MALYLLSANLGWIQGQFNFTANSLRYQVGPAVFAEILLVPGSVSAIPDNIFPVFDHEEIARRVLVGHLRASEPSGMLWPNRSNRPSTNYPAELRRSSDVRAKMHYEHRKASIVWAAHILQ